MNCVLLLVRVSMGAAYLVGLMLCYSVVWCPVGYNLALRCSRSHVYTDTTLTAISGPRLLGRHYYNHRPADWLPMSKQVARNGF